MSGVTSFAGSVFGIALSAMGLVAVSSVEHPIVYRGGQLGIAVFVILFIANLLLVARAVWLAVKKRRPEFDS